MPLFEYRCEGCAHLEEVLQKHSDPAPDACPACGQRGTMTKAISLTSFQLKGGGWYKDLYSSSSGKSEDNAKGGPAAADSAPKPTESKPAESKPTEPKAAEKKPAEAKPAEKKPAEKKPAESKASSASSPST